MSESFSQVVARLGSAQKGRARGAPAYSIYVNRRIGRVLAAAAYQAGLTPNQVTGISALFTFAGITWLAVAPPTGLSSIGIWLLLALGYALDSADGQVARLRGGGSLEGEWLDHVVDAAKLISLHLAVTIGLHRFTDVSDTLLLLPLAFTVVSGVTFSAMLLNDLLRSARRVPSSSSRGGATALRSLLLLPTDYGFLCMVFVLWWATPAFLAVYGLVLLASVGFLVLALPKWYREMRGLAGPTGGAEAPADPA